MPSMTPDGKTADPAKPGLVKTRRRINAARQRGVTPSDGGSTGRTDIND